MKTWTVRIPITAYDALIEVEAETEDEAITLALDALTNEHFEWRENDDLATAESDEDEDQ